MGEMIDSILSPSYVSDENFLCRPGDGAFQFEVRPEHLEEVRELLAHFEIAQLLSTAEAAASGWAGWFWPWRAHDDTRAREALARQLRDLGVSAQVRTPSAFAERSGWGWDCHAGSYGPLPNPAATHYHDTVVID